MEEPDVLVQEPRTPKHPRLLRMIAGALVVATLTGVGAAWLAGRYRAPGESAALDRCVVRAEAAVRLAETRLGSMVRYVSPALGTVSPDLDIDLYGLISTQADGLAPQVTETLNRCRDVELWPVSVARRRAQAAYVAFLEAEVARLRAISADGRAYYESYDEVRRLRQQAEEALSSS